MARDPLRDHTDDPEPLSHTFGQQDIFIEGEIGGRVPGMMVFVGAAENILVKNPLVTAFAVVGTVTFVSYALSKYLTKGKLNGSSIAILFGLLMAYVGGRVTGGSKGISDIPVFAGIGLLGGSMMRDFTIVATAFGADFNELKRLGLAGLVSLILGVLFSFTIGAGATLGADSSVIALSIGIGVVKSIAVMVITPLVSKIIKIDKPREAIIFGGLLGTTSGTSAAMAAIDPALVPYAAMTATFYTGLGCLVCPSVLYFAVSAIV